MSHLFDAFSHNFCSSSFVGNRSLPELLLTLENMHMIGEKHAA